MNDRPKIWVHLSVIFAVTTALLVGVKFALGNTFFEKTLQQLVAPVGLAWYVLILVCYFSRLFNVRFVFGLSLACWLILTIAGNGYLSNQAMKYLESDYLDEKLDNVGEMDAIVVLGGGTMNGANGEVQLGISGDRIAAAARLYHTGKTKRIICTGKHALKRGNRGVDPGDAARLILSQMGVEENDIVVVGGPNTGAEMVEIKKYLEDNELEIVGLVTSAWHMKRAMRLADQEGLSLEPVPANYRSRMDHPGPGWVIPGAEALKNSHMAIKEWLAGLASR